MLSFASAEPQDKKRSKSSTYAATASPSLKRLCGGSATGSAAQTDTPPHTFATLVTMPDHCSSSSSSSSSSSNSSSSSSSSSGGGILSFPFELGIRTLYMEEDATHPLPPPLGSGEGRRLLAMVEVGHAAGALKPPPGEAEEVDYVLVLDKSGSMQGTRNHNLLQGLRALLQLLAAGAVASSSSSSGDVTLVSFDHKASTIYGPGPASGALEQWDARIVDALRPSGSTSIQEALRVALCAAEPKLQAGRAIVMLLLTDGEDEGFAEQVSRFRASQLERQGDTAAAAATVLSQLGQRSGLATHFVGICRDADAGLLDSLAQLSMGTFVSIDEGDIKGLMGSLLGLVMEKLNHGALLSVQKEEPPSEERLVLAPRPVHLRIGTPTRIPFEVLSLLRDGEVNVMLKLELFPIGTMLPSSSSSTNNSICGSTAPLRVVLQPVTLSLLRCATSQDWEVALEHARLWHGKVAAALSSLVLARNQVPPPYSRYAAVEEEEEDEAEPTTTTTTTSPAIEALLARMRALVAACSESIAPAAEAIRALLAETEARVAEVVAARHDYERMRELSARCISDASTARNGGISIGDYRTESAGQAAMRSMSMQY